MIKFGTDGWRAVISEDFTFDNVKKVSQAIAGYIINTSKNTQHSIAVGYDTRFLSSKYARLVSEVMAGNGIKVILSDSASPTPSVSYCVNLNKLDGAVMITASHNPPEFNGIKFKAPYAGSASPQITKEIESCLGKNDPKVMGFEEGVSSGLISVKDLKKDYMKFIRSYLDLDLFNNKDFRMNVIADVMYGTGNHFFDDILEGRNINLKVIHDDYNPSFGGINPEPIPENLGELSKLLKEGDYDVGVVVDGDSDRVGAMTGDGEFIAVGWILSMLLVHFVEDKKLTGKVIKTISNSTLIEKIAKKYNLELEETPIGFKYICEIMQKEDVLIGGEESGGIGFGNYIPERDGILSALLLLEMMAYKKKSVLEIKRELEEEFGTYEYSRKDFKYPDDKKQLLFDMLDKKPFEEIEGERIVDIKGYDGRKYTCQDGSWLLFRLSGTEPKLRIYSEASTKERVNDLLNFGEKYAFSI